MTDDPAEILLPVFFVFVFAGGHCELFRHGQECLLFDVVNLAFPPPTLQRVLKDGFGETVVTCDISEPRKISSVDSCHEKFLWTHKEVDLALYSVTGFGLQEGDAEKSPQAFISLDPFFRSQQAGSMFHSRSGRWR